MDELTLFATLRPDVPAPSSARHDAIRAAIFAEQPRPDADRPDDGRGHERGRRPKRRGALAIAAAIVVAIGLGGLWVVADRRSEPPSSPPDATTPSLPSGDPLAVPRVAIGQPGWTLVRAIQVDDVADSDALVLVDAAAGLDGRRMSVRTDPPGSGSSFGTESQVLVGSAPGVYSAHDSESVLRWTGPDGHRWLASGSGVDSTTLTSFAMTVSADESGRPRLTETPAGFAIADDATVAALTRSATYVYQHDDGRAVELTMYAGGASMFRLRTLDAPGSVIKATNGEQILVQHENGDRYRADVQRGFWTWELDGKPFDSADQFVQFVESVAATDEATWEQSLPPGIIGGDQRSATVAALLDGVPTPADFAMPAGSDTATTDHDQLVVDVGLAVTCAWLDEWFTATDGGNTGEADQAATTLAGYRSWPLWQQAPSRGDLVDHLQEYADAVSTGSGILTGGGPVPITRDLAASGLGCRFAP